MHVCPQPSPSNALCITGRHITPFCHLCQEALEEFEEISCSWDYINSVYRFLLSDRKSYLVFASMFCILAAFGEQVMSIPQNIKDGNLTSFVIAAPDEFKQIVVFGSVEDAYKAYLNAKWKNWATRSDKRKIFVH